MWNVSADGDTTTLQIQYSGDSAKVQSMLLHFARAAYQGGFRVADDEGEPKAWEEMSNQEKLTISDRFCRTLLIKEARSWHIEGAARDAREAAQEETDYTLE